MKNRQIRQLIDDLCFSDHKMAFVSGPRQCGKTTLANMMLKARGCGAYHNWDDIDFRRLWTKKPKFSIPLSDGSTIPLVIYDEIHKANSWKRTLKGIFDTRQQVADLFVTGSARLNVYRKGSDSLLGRYYHFRLHPFTIREMETDDFVEPDASLLGLCNRSYQMEQGRRQNFEKLMEYGPFPEPLFAQNQRKTRLWRRSRIERVIREDLRDLSRTLELSRIEMLASLIPERVGTPVSLSSLSTYLEVSHGTIKRWLNYLKELYYLFEIKPYSKNIARSIRKEGKLYLWDPGEVQNRSARFENMIAFHLLKTCHLWTDAGEGIFDLNYLRNKEKQEIDFLITRDGQPWLPVEAKLSETTPSPNWKKFLPSLPCKIAMQLTEASNHWKVYRETNRTLIVAGAAEALFYLN